LIVIGGLDFMINIHDMHNGNIIKSLKKDGCINNCCFNNDGDFLAACGNDCKLTIYSTDSWNIFREFFRSNKITSCCFS
jgi:WD40 repeat protein